MALDLKVPPPVVALVTGALMWGAAEALPQAGFDFPGRAGAALAVALAGLAIAAWGVVDLLRSRTTFNPLKPESAAHLVSSGSFGCSRNPIYVGDLLVLAGWGVFLGNFAALLLAFAFVPYISRFQIEPEERALEGLFGEAYRGYRARVRRWV